jgi:putative membrane protein
MPSDRRLHPLSILFNIGRQFAAIALPLVLIVVGRGTDEDRWSGYALVFLVPYTAIAVGRYLSFRYRYEESDLVIRRGFFFRNQRHIPYSRIQNIDAVQNIVHRLAGVVDVRIQTGGGSEPEATLSVLTQADLEEMRRRVFAKRAARTEAAEAAPAEAAQEAAQELLHLNARELVVYGLVENRGLIVIGAALGLAWELAPSKLVEQYVGDQASRGLVHSLSRFLGADAGPSWSALGLAVLGLMLFLLLTRIFSVIWALIRLHGYRLTQQGDDLRAEYGLLTRVAATIPRRRIQTITIRESLWHRVCGRAAVRVATAGGKGEERERVVEQREWLAPILPRANVPELLDRLLPRVDLRAIDWQPVHPRAFRRALARRLAGGVWLAAFALLLLGAKGAWMIPFIAVWAAVRAHLYVKHLGWAITGDVVAFREGAFGRRTTVAPLVRIQVVKLAESPFDRRTSMARVRVDTAGGGHGVDVPYLPRHAADALYSTLAASASRTAFEW